MGCPGRVPTPPWGLLCSHRAGGSWGDKPRPLLEQVGRSRALVKQGSSPGANERNLASSRLKVLVCEMGLPTPGFRAAVKTPCIRGGAGKGPSTQWLLPKLEGTRGLCRAVGRGCDPCLSGGGWGTSEGPTLRTGEHLEWCGLRPREARIVGRMQWSGGSGREVTCPRASQWTGSGPLGLRTACSCTLVALSPSRGLLAPSGPEGEWGGPETILSRPEH